MIYYIDRLNGSPMADGRTPETARVEYADLELLPGDTVLFRRGSFMREGIALKPGQAGKPVTYGAYGQGEKPVFCGSVDISDPDLWREVQPSIWVYTRALPSEACNLIYNEGQAFGALRWTRQALCEQGDWFDLRAGSAEGGVAKTAETSHLFLYSSQNPARYYRHIECAVFGARSLGFHAAHTIVEDLAFEGGGVHALSGGEAVDLVIRNCDFRFIGGGVWNHALQIRFGNAIEFWNRAEEIEVVGCTFQGVYDSCVTHQGDTTCQPARHVVFHQNRFENYGMAAYEVRDHMPIDTSFDHNICLNAGCGFAFCGVTLPRMSEIWPQPMGHHVFLWRIEQQTVSGGLRITHNLFGAAPNGAAIYSIIDPAAEQQLVLDENQYRTGNAVLLNRLGGTNDADFEAYRAKTGQDAHSCCADVLESEGLL